MTRATTSVEDTGTRSARNVRSVRKHSVASVGTITCNSNREANCSVAANGTTACVSSIDSSRSSALIAARTSWGVSNGSSTGSASAHRRRVRRATVPVEITAHSVASDLSNSLHVMFVMRRRSNSHPSNEPANQHVNDLASEICHLATVGPSRAI